MDEPLTNESMVRFEIRVYYALKNYPARWKCARQFPKIYTIEGMLNGTNYNKKKVKK